MTQAPPNVFPTSSRSNLSSSRLVRFLSDLAVSDVQVSHKNFSDRLGRLINLSDSITLSLLHADLSGMSTASSSTPSETVVEDFLSVRTTIVQSVIKCFVLSAGPTRNKLPTPKPDTPLEKATSFDPYRRFYTTHQREIDYKVQNLRAHVRAAVSAHSVGLAQLAALDATLSESLSFHSRELFGVVPKLLEKRFDHLLREHQLDTKHSDHNGDENPALWIESGGWLEKFYREMRELLLAELEIRLQPVLGLVEALNAELEALNIDNEGLNKKTAVISD